MKQEKLSILFPCRDEVTYRLIPEETWHDLGMDALAEKVARQPQEVPLIQRVMMSLTDSPAVAAFRCSVFADILRHPEIRNRLMQLLDKVKMFYDYGVVNRPSGDDASIWDLMHHLEEYHDYIVTVEGIRECLSDSDLQSEGLVRLRELIGGIYESNGFAALRRDVEELRVEASGVRSLTIGVKEKIDFTTLKQLLSVSMMNYRPIYGKTQQVLHRYASFVATTNNPHPLTDPTGSRRYICLRIPEGLHINNAGNIDYAQLYAQVLHELRTDKAPYWFSNDEVARIQELNAEYLTKVDMTEMVEACFRKPMPDEKVKPLNSTEMLKIIQHDYTTLVINHKATIHLGNAMKALGYKSKEPHHVHYYYAVPLHKTMWGE